MAEALGGSIGGAVLQAAHGAMLGKAIGNLNGEAEIAYQNVMRWAEHARSLEEKLANLKSRLQIEAENNAALSKEVEAARLTLEKATDYRRIYYKAQESAHDQAASILKEIPIVRTRIRQLEKALQHSSADQASLHAVIKPYTELVDAYNLTGQLPQDLKEKASKVWDAFYSGGQLTADPKIQEMLDKPTEILTIWSP